MPNTPDKSIPPVEPKEQAPPITKKPDLTAQDGDEPVNSWLVNSSIPHCPVCNDHWRADNQGQRCCTANPAHDGCPLS